MKNNILGSRFTVQAIDSIDIRTTIPSLEKIDSWANIFRFSNWKRALAVGLLALAVLLTVRIVLVPGKKNVGQNASFFAAPEDEKILFVSTRDGNSEIYIMDADGNNQNRLTKHPAFDTSPSWSPDGTKILFSSARDDGGLGNPAVRAEIFIVDADGKRPKNLSELGEGFNGDPAWSPDCTKIAFGQSIGFSWELHVMDVNRVMDVVETIKDSINLTNLENADDRGPSWSPDGKKIAFYR